ncbi:PfkB family carbohydrate kinase [Staphylococcus saprophyticus]|uniref:PfkB family carbohydrate kinase n=1 Tax=Staphylococcus saprophyticus TaxID=29385 RepID=UPI0008535F01|nr:PfkB family carbohydrate kinase [Staphylococcus saprophyticus]MCM3120126.1 PfkB family carbohydrate kinase [Staphylococcus saprophyticus]MDW3878687.1 PfkB family carbohydrate kinase [Staphylococcus saprophyticus]MDW3921099.1 PfkB family carbohydrate kinase [Staphylococcus saprophyticus]MDW4019681.1 PfkB family carbohydrate kinase [Staphylococcus saprophyticus]MDW4140400.1 PfkB family carbohydrate kinase [Staphylococcus saprophyticus]
MTVYGFGEVLLRYTPPNYEQLKDANTLGVNVGGAELNALVTLAQFGHATEMLTALPNHALGQLALQKMYQSRVGTQLIQHVDGRMETYYMEESFGFRSGKVIYDREHSTFILDEATSALDIETENKIQKAFKKLSEHRTSLIIAHRLSTIKDVDRIIFIKDGQILEEGSHDVLMQHDGQYKQLYLSQFSDVETF